MGTFAFESQGASTILVYSMEAEEFIDALAVGMMANNKIEGVLSPGFIQQNEVRQLKYNLSSDIPLKEYFHGVVKKKQLIHVFRSLIEIFIQAEKYLLGEDSFLLDWQYIYINTMNAKIELLSFPIIQEQKTTIDFYEFTRRLINEVNFDESEDGRYVVTLMNYTKKRDGFSLRGFLGILEQIQAAPLSMGSRKAQPAVSEAKIGNKTEQTVKNQEKRSAVRNAAPEKPVTSPVQSAAKEEKQPAKKKLFGLPVGKKTRSDTSAPSQPQKLEKRKKEALKKPSKGASNMRIPNGPKDIPSSSYKEEGATTDVRVKEENGTTILKPTNQQNTISITQIRSGRKMDIQKEMFRIGKQNADFCVADNHTVSRNHADILVTSEGVFIRDNNSLNHTYVNEQMVQAGSKMRLEDGNILRLSDEKFMITIPK